MIICNAKHDARKVLKETLLESNPTLNHIAKYHESNPCTVSAMCYPRYMPTFGCTQTFKLTSPFMLNFDISDPSPDAYLPGNSMYGNVTRASDYLETLNVPSTPSPLASPLRYELLRLKPCSIQAKGCCCRRRTGSECFARIPSSHCVACRHRPWRGFSSSHHHRGLQRLLFWNVYVTGSVINIRRRCPRSSRGNWLPNTTHMRHRPAVDNVRGFGDEKNAGDQGQRFHPFGTHSYADSRQSGSSACCPVSSNILDGRPRQLLATILPAPPPRLNVASTLPPASAFSRQSSTVPEISARTT